MNTLCTWALLVFTTALLVAGERGQGGGYIANTIDREPSYRCGRAEVYSPCGANPQCQPTCDSRGQPHACPRITLNICYPGCICKKGFVRVVRGDQCIPLDKCEGRVKH